MGQCDVQTGHRLERSCRLCFEDARGLSAFAYISNRPAGATERAPEALEIGHREPAGPGAGMIMTVHAAGIGAPAHLHGVGSHGLCLAVRPGPIAVSAEAADRRPILHRPWGRPAIERLEG